ncbi:hypothetical protein [Marinovum sp.]|uniref:hypothetical protein n=1 Tax=Marinovum sp. TaxID=2024839 RepID=UPI002B26BC1D|nr:hypothetical protein [Marinovum sp.]
MASRKTDDPRDDTADAAGAARLRHQIDHGGAGDKVAFPDPSAAPLGTDDEAAGHPPSREQVRHAEAAELGRAAPKKRPPLSQRQTRRAVWRPVMLIGLVLMAGLILFAAMGEF